MITISFENFEGLDEIISKLETSTGTIHTDVENTYQAKFEHYLSLLEKHNKLAHDIVSANFYKKYPKEACAYSISENGEPTAIDFIPNPLFNAKVKYGENNRIALLYHSAETIDDLQINTTNIETYQNSIENHKIRSLIGSADLSMSVADIIKNYTTYSIKEQDTLTSDYRQTIDEEAKNQANKKLEEIKNYRKSIFQPDVEMLNSAMNNPLSIKSFKDYAKYYSEDYANFLNKVNYIDSDEALTRFFFSEAFLLDGTPNPEHMKKVDELQKNFKENILVNQNGISYVFLQLKNNENSHLRVMQKDEKTFINLKFNGSEENTTCQILEVGADEQNNLQLKVSDGQAYKIVTLPIDGENNKSLIEDLNKLIKNEEFEKTEIENGYPQVENLSPIEIEDVQPDITIEGNTELKSRVKKAQTLQPEEFNFNGNKINGLSQEFITQVLTVSDGVENRYNLERNQRFTILDSSEVLAIVSKGDENIPTAVFTKDKDGKVFLNLSTEYLNQFKAKNPAVEFENGTKNGDFTTFEIQKLSLDLNVGDLKIKGANTDFAILFSAPGCQVHDNENHNGLLKNDDKIPFDISVSNEFVKNAFKETNVCSLAKSEDGIHKEPGYSALLISMIQQERHNQGTEKQNEIVELNLNGVDLYSVPFKNDAGETQYLNLRNENNKVFAYMHLSTENSPNSLTVPKFWEIRETGLEQNKNKTVNSLYFGLVGSNKNITSVNFKLPNYEENKESLIFLKNTLLSKEFEQMNENKKSTGGTSKKLKLEETEFDIHPIPNEAKTKLESLDGIARLTRVFTPDTETVPPVTTLADPEMELEQIPPEFEESPKEEEEIHEEPNPKKDDENETPASETDKKNILQKISGWKGFESETGLAGLIGVFAILVMLSTLIPVLAIPTMLFTAGFIINAVKPWKLLGVADNVWKNIKAGRGKDKSKEFEKILSKEIEFYNNEIKTNKSKIASLKEEKENILKNPNIPAKKKQKLLEKIDKNITKENENLFKNQLELQKRNKLGAEYRIYQQKRLDEKLSRSEEKDLLYYENNINKVDAILNKLPSEEKQAIKKLFNNKSKAQQKIVKKSEKRYNKLKNDYASAIAKIETKNREKVGNQIKSLVDKKFKGELTDEDKILLKKLQEQYGASIFTNIYNFFESLSSLTFEKNVAKTIESQFNNLESDIELNLNGLPKEMVDELNKITKNFEEKQKEIEKAKTLAEKQATKSFQESEKAKQSRRETLAGLENYHLEDVPSPEQIDSSDYANQAKNAKNIAKGKGLSGRNK